MTNHKITSKQMRCTLTMFWSGSLVLVGSSPEAKQDYWISILIAGIMIMPLILLYYRIVTLYPGKNLFEIILKIFGDTFGKILTFLYVFFAIHLGSMIMKTFTTFIHILNMSETPEPAIIVFILLICIWSAKSGPENIARMAKFTWVNLSAFVILLFIIAIKDMHLDYLKPIMNTDFKLLISSAFSICMLPLGEMVICLSLFSALESQSSPLKTLIKSLALMIGLLVIICLRNILVLGIPSLSMFYFPSYEAVSILSLGDFFSRIEVLIGVNLMLAGFIKISVCIYTASLGLAKLMNVQDQKPLISPCGLIMATLSGLLYKNAVEIFDFVRVYRIYAIPFEIIIPLIIWIGAELQTRIDAIKNSGSNSDQTNQNSAPNSNPSNQSSTQNENQANQGSDKNNNQADQSSDQNRDHTDHGSARNKGSSKQKSPASE